MKQELIELIDKSKYIKDLVVSVYDDRVEIKFNEMSKQSSVNIKISDIKAVEVEEGDNYMSLHIRTEYGAFTIRDNGIETIIY